MKNCYIWAQEQIKYHGGKLAISWSDNWFLHFHVVYLKPDNTLWGYDPVDKSYISLWRFIIDGEWLFLGETVQYNDYVPFWDGLIKKIRKFDRWIAKIALTAIQKLGVKHFMTVLKRILTN